VNAKTRRLDAAQDAIGNFRLSAQLEHRPYLAESIWKVALQKSILAQICPFILSISNDEGYVDGFMRELTSADRLHEHFL